MRYLLLGFFSCCAAQSLSPGLAISKLAVDSSGSVYAAQGATVTKLNQWTATLPFSPLAFSFGSSGTLIAAGVASPTQGMVGQIDPGTGKVTASSSFAIPGSANVHFMAVTPAGNIILSGTLSQEPVTPGAVDIENGAQGFLIKLSPAGVVVWAAGGIGGAVTADAAENIYVAGSDNAGNFPTAANAFQKSASFSVCSTSGGFPSFTFPCPQQYIAKLSADGTTTLFSTYLTGTLGALPEDIALGADGSIYTVGSVQATDYPVTSEALIGAFPAKFLYTLCYCGVTSPLGYAASGFVSRLSSDGSTLLYSTYLGGSQWDNSSTIAVGKDGSMTVGGIAISPDFPGLPQQLSECMPGTSLLLSKQRDFLVQIAANGFPITSAQLIGGTKVGPGIACVTDAADTSYADTVSPGQLITINGFGVGPAVSGTASLASPAVSIGGVSVMFDGISAPLTAAGGTIVTAGVPFALSGKQQTTMTLLQNGQVFDTRTLNVGAPGPSVFTLGPNGKSCNAAPPQFTGVFTGGSPAPAPFVLNADGSINACDNPSVAGSAVTVLMNGWGSGAVTVTFNSGQTIGVIGTALSGNKTSVGGLAVQLPGTSGTKFLTIYVGGTTISDYQNYGGVPIYVK